ncbi:MAG: bifunctional diaminohydroxyphosphoribosylaminopyrimidine deaminase/5-amino-6-(5-phosphoribosylamino)uracil reductase RibD [Candidatus ainarchaeum sp.]|nr:bifunctional diaminohydroxyphosphoribosylaminopyrimidine deaminase/5-amino-6-(5-phosphoribosylamino)uracil reductase RibD [Candidatus ainarchaeum sp.]
MDRFMALALKLAKKADPFPNPRVGAVLVKDGRIIGRGYHRKAGMPHAEIEAIKDARRHGAAVRRSTLYVTLEPCSHTAKRTPPCTKAILASGIARVVFGMKDPNPLVSGARELRAHRIAATGPICQKEAAAMNGRYIRNVSGKPFVAIKMAMSADGKTATRTGDSKWISGAQSRRLVHRMRAEFGAVMVGAGTILKDNPRLTARIRGRPDPWRIVVDGDLCVPTGARIFANKDGKAIIATSGKAPRQKIKSFGRRALVLDCGRETVDLRVLVRALGAMGIKKILIEGGNELNAAALEAGIVDRLYLFVAPKLIGGRGAKPVIGGEGAARVADALALKQPRMRKSGPDLLLEYDLAG